mgnify:CR=1 FL=1
MARIFIIYPNFYSYEESRISVGGVQTYIFYLCKVILSNGFKPIVCQLSNTNFSIEYQNIRISGYSVSVKSKKRALFKEVLNEYEDKNDLILFASENFSVRHKNIRSLVIQHGIYWDLPLDKLKINYIFDRIIPFAKRGYIRKKVLNNFNNSKNKVCVDYNYLNWYRTMRDVQSDENIWVIPNFTVREEFNEKDLILKHDENNVNILFARRFVEIRGVRLFAKVCTRILDKYPNTYFTIAGEGPLTKEIDNLRRLPRVNAIKYEISEANHIHKNHHIAIVPSLGSEGTSISVAEAMNQGCAVIATNIGGITNMVINHYNGLLCNPLESELFDALELLVNNRELRKKLSYNAFQICTEAFTYDAWKEEWSKVIKVIMQRP